MSNKVFINYADEKFRKSQVFSSKMAKKFGKFDRTIEYGPDDIPESFKKEHLNIFSIKRGAGLWLWKPYIIKKAFDLECCDGDYLFYCDAGAFFIRSVDKIISRMQDQDIYVSCIPLKEKFFTKAEAFKVMDCEFPEYKESPQIQGGLICFRKSHRSKTFIDQWFNLCCDEHLLLPDNLSPGIQNEPGYIAHREDQSILSLLCKKEGILPHLDPTQFGKYPEKYCNKKFVDGGVVVAIPNVKEYPPLIILHRTPNIDFFLCLKQIILVLLPRTIGLKFIKR